jgi:transcriptional regulatory protein RtcR
VEGLRRERQEQIQLLAGDVCWGPTFRQLLDRVISVSLNHRGPLLLTGPTGSGKSFLARHIYELKKKRNLVTGEFMEINCATLQRERACSDLFGHHKGAFTGAHTSRKGLILQADNGILFLDEISELESEAQAILLTVLDTGLFLPVGSDKHEKVRFELITATNRDLRQAVRAGRFREDLYHRISALCFPLPGLDGRRDDIEPFIEFALRECVRERYDEALIRMHPEARDVFLRFARQAEWPGNLRQLKHSVARMAARTHDGTITRAIAEETVAELRAEQEGGAGEGDEGLLRSLLAPECLDMLDNIERLPLAHALRVCRRSPNLAAAGRLLFDKSRQKKTTHNDSHRLSQYLRKYGLNWEKVCERVNLSSNVH